MNRFILKETENCDKMINVFYPITCKNLPVCYIDLITRSGLYGSKFSVQVLRVPFGPGNTKKKCKKNFRPDIRVSGPSKGRKSQFWPKSGLKTISAETIGDSSNL